MELTGRIIAVLPAQSGVSARTGNNWMSQDYVIEVPGQFPRKCLFRIFGEDRIKQFAIQQGEDLTVQFDIDAHEFNGRWFNDIRAYNVIRGQVQQQQPAVGSPVVNQNVVGATSPFPPAQEPSSEGAADDLPF
ncbi:MAG: DUF3127 domain-containing protein [Prevotella sp.]|nr:DUF3127 domain-containing protein [Prevotella sp.]